MCAAETPRPLAEPVPVPEIFVTHIGKVEHIGNLVRLWLCSPETLAGCEADGQVNVVKVKLVVPKGVVVTEIAGLITDPPENVSDEIGSVVRKVPS